MSNQNKHSCPRCQIGTMQPTTATYSTVHRGALLTVPNIPAWNCDICQYMEYDDEVMARLEALAGEYLFSSETQRMNAKLAPIDGETGDGKPGTRVKPQK